MNGGTRACLGKSSKKKEKQNGLVPRASGHRPFFLSGFHHEIRSGNQNQQKDGVQKRLHVTVIVDEVSYNIVQDERNEVIDDCRNPSHLGTKLSRQ
ncbi:hypothetical protein [Cohnella sp. REN36]|uniref:hypothetical protein n=1 Tax=Cohnella sp. REN36 TaxID=2887347 RepID=UPI001D14CD7B|nr:hypothetical protein [Cohnella sp. REN36]MCC3374861.1 hypothetical protein [Cohnella sp. REN36]